MTAAWQTKVSEAPKEMPLSLADFKAHLRATHDTEDAYLEGLIIGATEHCEQRAGLALITQTVDVYAQDWPGQQSVLPVHPVQSVTWVKYYDSANVLQTLPGTYYIVTTHGPAPRLTLAYGYDWPALYQRPDAVQIRLLAGYGPTSADVPHLIRQWIAKYAAMAEEHRLAVIDGRFAPLPAPHLDGLLDRYRVPQGM